MTKITQKELTQSDSSLLRTYKDSVFRMLFNDEEKALELYSAITGKTLPVGTKVKFTTLKEAIFKTKKNDISFLLNDVFIILLEHQSTLNPNLATRDLIYYTTTIQRLYSNREFYNDSLVPLPRPEFIILYNGKDDIPDYQVLNLSDNFKGDGEINLQLSVKVYNINEGRNPEIMKHCETLEQYSRFVSAVRAAIKQGEVSDKDFYHLFENCIRQGILPEFLTQYGTEVISMLFAELTEEEARDLARENGFEAGRREGLKAGLAEGRAEGRAEGLAEGRTEGLEEGLKEGIKEGLARANRLNELLLENGRIEDLRKATTDAEYQKRLFEEFDL